MLSDCCESFELSMKRGSYPKSRRELRLGPRVELRSLRVTPTSSGETTREDLRGTLGFPVRAGSNAPLMAAPALGRRRGYLRATGQGTRTLRNEGIDGALVKLSFAEHGSPPAGVEAEEG